MRPASSIEISTQDIPADKRREHWLSHVNRHIITLDCPDESETGIDAHLRQYQVGDLLFNHIRADAHGVQRNSTNIRQDDREYAMLSLMLDGHGFACQGVQGSTHSTGDAIIYNTQRPYSLAFPDQTEMMVINLPLELLRDVFGEWNQKDLIKLERQSGKSRFDTSDLFGTVQSYCLGNLSPELAQERLMEQLSGILSPSAKGQATKNLTRLLARSKNYIDRNLQFESLNAEHISQHLNVSLRQLARAFELEGCSVSRYIWNRRLDQCHLEISNNLLINTSISEIAFRWGFNHSAHFSRSYKNRFGESPSETRRRLRN